MSVVRREFLQLAKTYKPTKNLIAGWFLSEKLDGTRCLWDGGLSRGLPTVEIPWAGLTNPKTGEPKAKVKPVASGLWSRYGNPIMAPDWFLDKLPEFPCDGELWAGRGNFQLCRSICAGDTPDERFDQIKFAVFSAPPLPSLFQTGLIKNPQQITNIHMDDVDSWMAKNKRLVGSTAFGSTLEQELFALSSWENWDEQVFLLNQILLPNDEDEASIQLARHMNKFLDEGAEGIILRNPMSKWKPKRVADCLKFKPWCDSEGTVVGFTSGRETDKGSKLRGLIGALILDYKGQRLEISGLQHKVSNERAFDHPDHMTYAWNHPGEDMPEHFQGAHFKLGDTITFKYRELSDDGIPKEARYWRKRDDE